MRRFLVPALVCALAGPAGAELAVGPATFSGEAELGVRGIGGDDRSSKYEEYREQSPGLFGSLWFTGDHADGSRYLRGFLRDVGERDEAYRLELGWWNRSRLWLELDDTPHVYSNAARSLYVAQRSELLLLPPGVQSDAQTSAALAAALAGATGRSLETRLRSGRLGGRHLLAPGLELGFDYRLLDRQGTRPLGLGFGTPGGSFVNVPAPVDDQTHRTRLGLGLVRPGLALELDYRGSRYENELDRLVVANPNRENDDVALGSSLGRLSAAPDNDSHGLGLSGSLAIPAGFPAQLAFAISYARRRQEDGFLPHTINTLILDPGLALPQGDLDGEVGVLSLNLRATARPRPGWTLGARYRLYDHDSRTSAILFPAHVETDSSLEGTPRIATPLEYRRHDLDLEVARRLGRARLELGYGWNRWERGDDRTVRSLGEHTGRVEATLRTRQGGRLRASYAASFRRGSSYRPFAHLSEALQPADRAEAAEVGPFPRLRQYDVADRIRQRVDVSADLAPTEALELALHAQFDDQRYDDTDFGLVAHRSWAVGSDLGYQLSPWLGLVAYYSYEELRYDLESRFRPRRFIPPFNVVDAPANNWDSRTIDRVHNAGVALEAELIPQKLEGTLRYTLQTADAETRARAFAGFVGAAPSPTTAGDGGNGVTYPDIDDVLQIFSAALRYRLSEVATLGFEYRYERFDLDDFQTDGLAPFIAGSNVNNSGGVTPSLDVFLGDTIDDYDAHIFELVLRYRF